ncbi:MAG TPA: alternative ribosome rescue aminoacyl-tRNA hydrolase ArfB [Flavobacteriaceae bacterium]|nr:alternative ribosome rescue aminoacyl-tRNA hydrolase ArfB [Flavobacteriaceae bacterium]
MKVDILLKELNLKAVRSGGAGGQHVNKTSSKVEVAFSIPNSAALSEDEKQRLLKKQDSRISKEGVIVMQSDETRSQHKNKSLVIERLLKWLEENLKEKKLRKKTKLSKAVIEKRLKEKKRQALKKLHRKNPEH